jgi:Hydrazine synthase alpha subunit middle domain
VETSVFQKAGVKETAFRNFLKANNLALAVIRNATTRDLADRQQPFNLRVPGGAETKFGTGKVYDVSSLQLLQADLIRGYGGTNNPQAGRRVLPQLLHDSKAVSSNSSFTNFTPSTSSASLSSDGSVAAFVPARRAMTWQLNSPSNVPVVRERYWITFQPGEIRVCTSCHGLNEKDQAGNGEPQNEPKALLELLQKWKAANP